MECTDKGVLIQWLLEQEMLHRKYIMTNSVTVTADDMKVSKSTMERIVARYRKQLSLKARKGGNHTRRVMKDYVQLCIEFMLAVNPKLYLSEIRDNLHQHLGLNGRDLPSITAIHDFLKLQRFTRKKCTKIALERFSQANMLRRQAFISWRQTIDPRKLFFVDETGFLISGEIMTEYKPIIRFHHSVPRSDLIRLPSLH